MKTRRNIITNYQMNHTNGDWKRNTLFFSVTKHCEDLDGGDDQVNPALPTSGAGFGCDVSRTLFGSSMMRGDSAVATDHRCVEAGDALQFALSVKVVVRRCIACEVLSR